MWAKVSLVAAALAHIAVVAEYLQVHWVKPEVPIVAKRLDVIGDYFHIWCACAAAFASAATSDLDVIA